MGVRMVDGASEEAVDELGQRGAVIVVIHMVDVVIRLHALVDVIELAVLQEGHPL